MLFLYSRKTQCLFLLVWIAALGLIYENTVSKTPFLAHEMTQKPLVAKQEPVLGEQPEQPKEVVPPPPPPPPKKTRPLADATLNIWDGESFALKKDDPKALLFSVDYVPAKKNGFNPSKIVSYYIKNSPTYVVDFGKSWKGTVDTKELATSIPEIENVKLIITKAKTLRLVIRAKSMNFVRNIKLVQKAPTDTGIALELRIP